MLDESLCFGVARGGLSRKSHSMIKKGLGSGKYKKKGKPWGDFSFADLIRQAIESSLEQRMRVHDIYCWFTTHLPCFAGQEDLPNSTGWKKSIRHNLSMHSCFVRDAADHDKSAMGSYWVVDYDQLPSRIRTRRRQQISTTILDNDKTTSLPFNDGIKCELFTSEVIAKGSVASPTSDSLTSSPRPPNSVEDANNPTESALIYLPEFTLADDVQQDALSSTKYESLPQDSTKLKINDAEFHYRNNKTANEAKYLMCPYCGQVAMCYQDLQKHVCRGSVIKYVASSLRC